MRKIYQKAIIMLSVACMGYATPAFAADAVVKTNKAWLQYQGEGFLLFFCQSDANGGGWNKQDLSV